MTITNLSQIVSTDTFGVWIQRTNEVIESLEDVVTIGAAQNNVGNVTIEGDIITDQRVVTDTIAPLTSLTNLVEIDGQLRTEANLYINNDGPASLIFENNGTDTWTLTTSADHNTIRLAKGTTEFIVDQATNSITANNLTIDPAILPQVFEVDTITADVTGTVSSLSNQTTTALAEGNNLYFTTARARSSVSGGTGITYNSTTGVISLSQALGTTSAVTFGSVTAGDFKTGAWEIDTDASGHLCFYNNGNLRFRLLTNGYLEVEGDVTAFAVI
jgi:hypothetical protein